MAEEQEKICFQPREFKGSRFRCLLATHQPRPRVVAFLNSLVQPFASVGEKDRFMPDGFPKPEEARLDEISGFPTDKHRRELTDWWLAVRDNANTPNWDLICTCTIDGKQGLVLVEAKAHADELHPDDRCGARNEDNRQRIEKAIRDVNQNLGKGWALSADSRYQLSNRFVWAWKLASLGIPVVLVYLGFLNVPEMSKSFADHKAWEDRLLSYGHGVVPPGVWNSDQIKVNGIHMIPLIRSADVNVTTT